MRRVSGSIYARVKPDGNVEIGTTHVGGLVQRRDDSWVTVIEAADLTDLRIVLQRLDPEGTCTHGRTNRKCDVCWVTP